MPASILLHRLRPGKILAFIRLFSLLFAGLLVLALISRLLWRDSLAFATPTYYAVPYPLHLASWVFLAVLWWRPWRRRALAGLGMATLAGVLWTVQTKHLCREIAAPAASGPRVFFWNIGHIEAVPPAMHELLNEHDPDIAAFCEAEMLGEAGQQELRERHPTYQVIPLSLGMICMVKGQATPVLSQKLPQKSVVHLVEAALTRFPDKWRICLTDIGPLPPLPRDRMLSVVFDTAAGSPRTFVLGDFNTPVDSVTFEHWWKTFHHGFADCASWHGPLETWGYGVPILAIDHIWMSQDLVPVTAKKGTGAGEDHSWILVDCGR